MTAPEASRPSGNYSAEEKEFEIIARGGAKNVFAGEVAEGKEQ
jgi:hypothetical protein